MTIHTGVKNRNANGGIRLLRKKCMEWFLICGVVFGFRGGFGEFVCFVSCMVVFSNFVCQHLAFRVIDRLHSFGFLVGRIVWHLG